MQRQRGGWSFCCDTLITSPGLHKAAPELCVWEAAAVAAQLWGWGAPAVAVQPWGLDAPAVHRD